jgi:hypothetical protein
MAPQKRKDDRIISHLGGEKSITTRFKDCPVVCRTFPPCVVGSAGVPLGLANRAEFQ